MLAMASSNTEYQGKAIVWYDRMNMIALLIMLHLLRTVASLIVTPLVCLVGLVYLN